MLRLHDEPSVWKVAPAIAAILAMLGAVPTATAASQESAEKVFRVGRQRPSVAHFFAAPGADGQLKVEC